MKTNLSLGNAADVETPCLAVVVLDRGTKNKPEVTIQSKDASIASAVADIIGSGEVTAKMFETTWIHAPAKLKAKRLLLIGGGKEKAFSAVQLRRLAGAAVRAMKPRAIRSFAMLAPQGIDGALAVKAMIEGAFVGDFDPDTYKSDRKDQKIDSVTVIATGDQAKLQQAHDEGRIIGESQNFTRDLVNEPSNRMTPTILGRPRKENGRRSRPGMRNLRRRQDQRIEDGCVLERGPRFRRTALPDRHALRTRGRACESRCWDSLARELRSTRAAFPLNRPTAWRR